MIRFQINKNIRHWIVIKFMHSKKNKNIRHWIAIKFIQYCCILSFSKFLKIEPQLTEI